MGFHAILRDFMPPTGIYWVYKGLHAQVIGPFYLRSFWMILWISLWETQGCMSATAVVAK